MPDSYQDLERQIKLRTDDYYEVCAELDTANQRIAELEAALAEDKRVIVVVSDAAAVTHDMLRKELEQRQALDVATLSLSTSKVQEILRPDRPRKSNLRRPKPD